MTIQDYSHSEVEAANPCDNVFVRETLGDAEIVHVFGEADIASAKRLEAAIRDAGAPGGRVVVDLGPCSYIDSSILAVLVRTERVYGSRLTLVVAPTGAVRRLLAITSLADYFQIVESPDGAFAA